MIQRSSRSSTVDCVEWATVTVTGRGEGIGMKVDIE